MLARYDINSNVKQYIFRSVPYSPPLRHHLHRCSHHQRPDLRSAGLDSISCTVSNDQLHPRVCVCLCVFVCRSKCYIHIKAHNLDVIRALSTCGTSPKPEGFRTHGKGARGLCVGVEVRLRVVTWRRARRGVSLPSVFSAMRASAASTSFNDGEM